ncbi:MAG: hypothetical protein AAF921_15375 [Cyanobacteria bacterium P01_D01_bin.44]
MVSLTVEPDELPDCSTPRCVLYYYSDLTTETATFLQKKFKSQMTV